jgi:N6-L-threonylcarbamoyladenine synthase
MLNDGLDFSFSGLKTAVWYAVRDSKDLAADRDDLAASFQNAVFDVLISKVLAALRHTGRQTVVLGGGVACSRTLVARMSEALKGKARLAVAEPRLNADNAAMIAAAGRYHLSLGETSPPTLDADPSLPWPGLVTQPEPTSTSGSV